MTKVILTATQASSNCKAELELETKTSKYLEFLTVRKMIYKFLTCDRIIFVPTKIPKLTEIELANKLNITSAQLRRLQKSHTSYKQAISKINLLSPSQGERSDGEKPAVAGDFQQSAASAENL